MFNHPVQNLSVSSKKKHKARGVSYRIMKVPLCAVDMVANHRAHTIAPHHEIELPFKTLILKRHLLIILRGRKWSCSQSNDTTGQGTQSLHFVIEEKLHVREMRRLLHKKLHKRLTV